MYGRLWRMLPGPTAARAVQALVLVVLAVAVCFVWVFPAVAPHLPINDGTVGH